MNTTLKQVLLVGAVLVGAIALTTLLVQLRPEPESAIPETALPTVEWTEATASSEPIRIMARGTLQPRNQVGLTPEVSGMVTKIHPQTEAGFFVRKGTTLIELDRSDYEAALSSARAELESRQAQMVEEEALAEQAREDLERLRVEAPGPLALREPQLARAEAALLAAEASLATAQRNLERTILQAPFDAIVLRRHVDLGQHLTAGGPAAVELVGTEKAEVRVRLRNHELNLLGLAQSTEQDPDKLSVLLRGPQGSGERHAYLEALSPAIDERSRLREAIIVLEDPYGIRDGNPQPLVPGTFVEAIITGPQAPSLFRLPRTALIGTDRVRVLEATTEDGVYQVGEITVRLIGSPEEDGVTVQGPLEPGDKVTTSPLHPFVDGMRVRIDPKSARDD